MILQQILKNRKFQCHILLAESQKAEREEIRKKVDEKETERRSV